MASYFPQTEEQFSQIKGVGLQKLERYGEIFLNEITTYTKPLSKR
jgi:superfamily II DNA helicase RecQ